MVKVEKIITFCEENDYVLSFGLAPNPFGFTFIYEGEKRDRKKDKKLDNMLSDLNGYEEKQLRKEYF